MGMYDRIEIGDSISLPEFPYNKIDPNKLNWQSKSLGGLLEQYRIEKDSVYKEHVVKREATDEELNEKAKEKGYSSYEEWEEEWNKFINKDESSNKFILPPQKQVIDEKYWAKYHKHGTINFYCSTKYTEDWEEEDDYWFTYEARYTKGELDDVVLIKKEKIQDS